MSTALAQPKQELAPQQDSPGSMLAVIERAALNPDVDVDKMERLLDMQIKLFNQRAKSEFDNALAAFQSECPPIPRLSKGHNSNYAKLEQTVPHIMPYLRKHGFSYRFATEHTQEGPMVICTLSHVGGHFATSSFAAPPDKSGGKNDIQARGSTIAYARRYALADVLGLIFTDDDTDGSAELLEAVVTIEQRLAETGITDDALSRRVLELCIEHRADYWREMPGKLIKRAASEEGWAKLFGKEGK